MMHKRTLKFFWLTMVLAFFVLVGTFGVGSGQGQQIPCSPTQPNTFCSFTFYDLPVLPGPVNAGPAWSPDGKQIAFAFQNALVMYRLADGQKRLLGMGAQAWSLAYSPDGQWLATGNDAGTIKLWNASDGMVVRVLAGGTERINSLDFSPDGKLLAAGTWRNGNHIKLWSIADGSLVRTLDGQSGAVRSVNFSSDGKLLASGSVDDPINLRLWSIPDGTVVRRFTDHQDREVLSVKFSPDGQLLASGGYPDNKVKLWRVADGSLVRTLQGAPGTIWSLDFSSDGQFVAAGSKGRTAVVWRVADGSLVATLTGNQELDVGWLRFSPTDPKLLVTVSVWVDHIVHLWRLP